MDVLDGTALTYAVKILCQSAQKFAYVFPTQAGSAITTLGRLSPINASDMAMR